MNLDELRAARMLPMAMYIATTNGQVAAVTLVGLIVLTKKEGFLEDSVEEDTVLDQVEVSRDHPRENGRPNSTADYTAVVLVFAASRPAAIANHLGQLIRLRPSAAEFPIVVSQDGDNAQVAAEIDRVLKSAEGAEHWQHERKSGDAKTLANYGHIARHYHWALEKIFVERNRTHVIVTEDDLDIAADFFSYFRAMRPVLDEDPSVWCVSAWNDNGAVALTDRSQRGERNVWRTDFFPGLGWMLTRETWMELREDWPDVYWDDWLRKESVRKGRVCIRPEVSRTAHNMELAGKGSSGGLYRQQIASVRLPDRAVEFGEEDAAAMMKERYDRSLEQRLLEARELAVGADFEGLARLADWTVASRMVGEDVRLVFETPRQWRQLATKFGLMADVRGGMPRTAYYGVVPFFYNGRRVYAVRNATVERAAGYGGRSARGRTGSAAVQGMFRGDPSSVYDPRWEPMTRFLEFETAYCRKTRYHYTGPCDPESPEMKEWFTKRRWQRRLQQWGDMIVN